ncbi:hypothetical protein, partial [uncultured Sulfitobacter sp.]
MKHYIILGVAVVALAGCAGVTDRLGLGKRGADAAPPTAEARAEASLSSATAAARPPAGARTADALDTTTAEQRAEASKPAAAGAKSLGTTVASLGSATEPGLWMKTPLVKSEMQGRVTNPATGKSSTVELIPLDGPASGGSRMSLSAL